MTGSTDLTGRFAYNPGAMRASLASNIVLVMKRPPCEQPKDVNNDGTRVDNI